MKKTLLAIFLFFAVLLVIFTSYLVYKVDNMDSAFIECLEIEMADKEYNSKNIKSVDSAVLYIARNGCAEQYENYLTVFLDKDNSNKTKRKIYESDDYIKNTYAHIFYKI